ncbi:MAG: YpjP family protein [Sporolactobacillus sp.]
MLLNFLRKSIIILVTVLTFGAIAPTFTPHVPATRSGLRGDVQNQNGTSAALQAGVTESERLKNVSRKKKTVSPEEPDGEQQLLAFSLYASQEFAAQGLHKFGPRVGARIGDQYVNDIIPLLDHAIREASSGHDGAWVSHLAVTHCPAAGLGERIVHIYQKDSGKEVLKLHVRREHPPQEGYWFDFHYHTVIDNFQQHHSLKKIYWGKNTPPSWKA